MLIVFEGMDGSGKTTQSDLLYKALMTRGLRVVKTKEPGETRLGQQLRKILLDPANEGISQRAEMLLFAADRADHVEKIVIPALQDGKIVICDRYIPSTVAYQSYASGIDKNFVLTTNNWAAHGINPDVVFYLDVSPHIGLSRAVRNRFEEKGEEYFNKVVQGFREQADQGEHWVELDGHFAIDYLHEQILDYTLKLLG